MYIYIYVYIYVYIYIYTHIYVIFVDVDDPASLLVLERVAQCLLQRRRHSPRDFEVSDA